MRPRSRILAWTAWALAALWSATAVSSWDERLFHRLGLLMDGALLPTAASGAARTPGTDGEGGAAPTGRGWFEATRPFCIPGEVEERLRAAAAPPGFEGTAYEAACWALAGRVERTRLAIEGLEGQERWMAAGVVFNAVHPVADAGNDEAVLPVMELVVDFWPNHYQALYHAGKARFERGDHVLASSHLQRFLLHYPADDAWRERGERLLSRIDIR